VGEQKIEQFEIGPGDMHGGALEAEYRLVDAGDEITGGLQQPPHLIDVSRFNRHDEQLAWRLRQCINLALQLRPAGNPYPRAITSSASLRAFRRRWVRMQCANALYRASSCEREPWQAFAAYPDSDSVDAGERSAFRSRRSADMVELLSQDARYPRDGEKEGHHWS